MTAMICGLMHNPELAEKLKIKIDPAFKPKAVGLNCGVFVQEKPVKPADDDVQANQMYRFRLGLAKGTLGHSYLKKLRLASPYYYVNGDFPPAYIITALGDPLTKEQSELMDKKYTEMKVPHQFKCYGTPAKPLGHVFFCNMFEGEGTKAMDDELNYFKTFIS
jgi:acetyl esterase/lipase